MTRRPFVEIQWDDAASCASWATEDALPSLAKATNRGWVIKEDEAGVTLAASMIAPSAPGEEALFGDVTVIPRGCITGRKMLR